jgi:DNA-binding transcriptional ArsR family regulator
MSRDRDFTAVGRALAVPARSTICNLLMDGSRRPAGELARLAGVSASTASDHLGALVAAGLLRCHVQGRHRFYAITGPEVGAALEALGLVVAPAPVSGFRGNRRAEHLAARHQGALVTLRWSEPGSARGSGTGPWSRATSDALRRLRLAPLPIKVGRTRRLRSAVDPVCHSVVGTSLTPIGVDSSA